MATKQSKETSVEVGRSQQQSDDTLKSLPLTAPPLMRAGEEYVSRREEARQKLMQLFDPSIGDDAKQALLSDPEVQSLLSFGIYFEVEEILQLLKENLSPLLTEEERQTRLLEILASRKRKRSRRSLWWKVGSYILGNLPGLASLSMHLLGVLSRLQTELLVATSVCANIVLTILLVWQHLRHHRTRK